MLSIVEDGLHRWLHLRVRAELVTGVEVAIEAWEVAAAHLKTDAVPLVEEIAGRPEVDLVFVDLAGRDRPRSVGPQAVSGADDAVGEIARVAVRVDIDQLPCEIGIRRGGCRPEVKPHRTGHLGVLLQRRGRVDEYVRPRFHRALVEGAGGQGGRVAAELPADSGDRVEGIVEEDIWPITVRRFIGKRAVTRARFGVAATAEEELGLDRARQRPLVLGAPGILAHDEDPYRRLVVVAVVDPLQPTIEETQCK